ncbi:unnamed protein product (macronuclear) [Paramecium tetraurelia]|uniref:TLC domain-containing protein n=1 Tax=Paramecium tetraurelia TaxID=5888 RepID=A0CR87_PARTE|nr:uncharacterized protein GSPATT00009619001 [Paramecium tetraurelia]CAK73304.1 unnamed protein product [Paramecium tetraurelia]|eukprot:XP_001440701.1 hypothetical protein (macronuclear) [Paramecium tetraurelia strain d4-2]
MGIPKGIKRLGLDDIQLLWNSNTNCDDHLQNLISGILAGREKNGTISIAFIGYYTMNPLDKLIRPFIFYGPIYYLFDIIVKVGSGKAFESGCSMSFFSHHVITLVFLPFAVYSKHVPWFIISTGLFHAILLCFKRSYLQYIYLVAVLLYHYGILQPPFNKQQIYFYVV